MPNDTLNPSAGKHCLATLLVCLASCTLVSSPGSAQNKPEIKIEDVIDRGQSRLRRVGWLGSDALYGLYRSTAGEPSVRRLQSDGPAGADLAAGLDARGADRNGFRTISVSPDGKRLVSFVDNQWRTLELAAQSTTIMTMPERPAGLPENFAWYMTDWADDGRRVAISEMYDARARSSASVASFKINGVTLEETAPASDRTVVQQTRLLLVDAVSGDNLGSWVFPGCTSAGHSFSPATELFVTLTCFEVDVPHTKLIRINTETKKYEEVFRANSIIQGFRPKVSPDGKLIAFPLNNDGSNWAAFVDLAILDSGSGEIVQRLRPNANQGLAMQGEYYWAADGKSLYVSARGAGLDEIWSLSLTGDHKRLAGGDRRRFAMSLSADGAQLSYITLDGYGYRDIRTLDTETGREDIFYVIDDPASQFALGQWQQIEWKSTDGIRPKGWLITPPDFDPANQYPLFVYIHGNGTGSDLYLDGAFTGSVSGGPLEWHALAALGYVVFVPDYRMSGNYGPEPIRQSRRDRLDGAVYDALDVISGVNHLVSLGYVNSDRMAVMGHSLGGARAFKILTDEPRLFRAAVLNESSGLDRRSMFEAASSGSRTGSDFNRFMRTIYGKELAEDPDPYKTNYVLDAVRIQTPTLFLRGGYGGNASPTMYASHETAFTLIRQAGVPTRYIMFPDEGHTYSTPEAALVAFDLVTDWLAKHMPAEPGDADFVVRQRE